MVRLIDVDPHLPSDFSVGAGTAVAIDVLRATTTIITALENGANKIIPSGSIEEARVLARMTKEENILLAGEYQSLRPSGFDLGNSPLEYTLEKVAGKDIVLATTNGTRLLRLIKHPRVLIGALRNAAAVAGELAGNKKNIRIFCAGRQNRESFEDNLAAGAIVYFVLTKQNFDLTENAMTVLHLFQHYQNSIVSALRNCDNGKRLIEKGFAGDVAFSAECCITSKVPVYCEGIIR